MKTKDAPGGKRKRKQSLKTLLTSKIEKATSKRITKETPSKTKKKRLEGTKSKDKKQKKTNLRSCSRCQRLCLKCSGEMPCTYCIGKGYDDCVYESYLRCNFCMLSEAKCSIMYPCKRCLTMGIQCFFSTAVEHIDETVKISLLRTCTTCKSNKKKCFGGYPCAVCSEKNIKCVIDLRSALRGNAKSCDFCKQMKTKCLGGYPCSSCSNRRTCSIHGNEAVKTEFARYNTKMREDISSPMQNPQARKIRKTQVVKCFCALCTSTNGATRWLPQDKTQQEDYSSRHASDGTNQSSIKNPVLAFLQSKYVKVSKIPEDYNPRNSLIYCSVQFFFKTLKWYLEKSYEGEIPNNFFVPRIMLNACREGFKKAGLRFPSDSTKVHTKMWYGIEVKTKYFFGVQVDVSTLVPHATSFLEAAKQISQNSHSKQLLYNELFWPRKTNANKDYGSVYGTAAIVSSVINHNCRKNYNEFTRLVPLQIEKGQVLWTYPSDSKETGLIMKLLSDARSVQFLPVVVKKIEDYKIIPENEVNAPPLSDAELSSCFDWIEKRKQVFQARKPKKIEETNKNTCPPELSCKWWYTLDSRDQRLIGEWCTSRSVLYVHTWKQYWNFAEMQKRGDHNDTEIQDGLKYALSALITSESIVLIRAIVSRMYFLGNRLKSSAFKVESPCKTKYSGMLICLVAMVGVLPRFGYSINVIEDVIFRVLSSLSEVHQRDILELKPLLKFLEGIPTSETLNGENLLCCTSKRWKFEILEQRVHDVTSLLLWNKAINRTELNNIIEDINRLIAFLTRPSLKPLVKQLMLRFN